MLLFGSFHPVLCVKNDLDLLFGFDVKEENRSNGRKKFLCRKFPFLPEESTSEMAGFLCNFNL